MPPLFYTTAFSNCFYFFCFLQQETTNLAPTSSTRNSPPNPKATSTRTTAKTIHTPLISYPPSPRAPSKSPQREAPHPPSPTPAASSLTTPNNHPSEVPCTTPSAPTAPSHIPGRTPRSSHHWFLLCERPDKGATLRSRDGRGRAGAASRRRCPTSANLSTTTWAYGPQRPEGPCRASTRRAKCRPPKAPGCCP